VDFVTSTLELTRTDLTSSLEVSSLGLEPARILGLEYSRLEIN